MIHTLLVLAVILFLLWVFFGIHVGGLMNLILIVALIAAVLWALGFFRRGTGTTY